jgi:hypothetical protein
MITKRIQNNFLFPQNPYIIILKSDDEETTHWENDMKIRNGGKKN